MPAPRVLTVRPGSPAWRAGVREGDELCALGGHAPRDVIEYHQMAEGESVRLSIGRAGTRQEVVVEKSVGEPLGLQMESAVFDAVQTCDNHCEFCFIFQLPKGLRPSLYVKDDDYRLSFLYGNFTTLTRFTEADLERVVSERLSPLNVSIHSTNPELRAEMLRNRRGSTSLRWLEALLDSGIEVNGQIVVCPGINDGHALEETLCGVLDRFPGLSSLCVVPLGVSRLSPQRLRPHTTAEAHAVSSLVAEWQEIYLRLLGRRLVHLADEYYLMTGDPFPPAESYEGFPMHEDGVGMARRLELELDGVVEDAVGPRAGFFSFLEGAPEAGYRSKRRDGVPTSSHSTDGDGPPPVLITGELGAKVLEPLLEARAYVDVRVLPVPNRFFGGNIGVTGLLVGRDIAEVLSDEPGGHRYLLPDVCLSEGRFLDGMRLDELPHPVEVIGTDGHSLRHALGG